MATYELIAFDPTQPHVLVEADEHAMEGTFHVFRRTATVLGRPRRVVVRRIPESSVAALRLLPPSG